MLSISDAAKLLKEGNVVAFPTETVYGLGALLSCPDAVARVYAAKKRPSDNPLIAHISDFHQLEKITQNLPPLFFKLAHAFWPGPLTIVVPKHPSVSSLPCAGLDTIAIRMPRHPTALKLIRAVGEPLVAPSANLSGRPSPTTADHVLHDFKDTIAGILDGGPCIEGLESTVVALLPGLQILRPGAITAEQLRDIAPIQETSMPLTASPGTRHRHYAPKTPLKLCLSFSELPRNDFVLSTVSLKQPHRLLTPQNFYATLREIDRENYSELYIYCRTDNEALRDRIFRAANLVEKEQI